jgi:hypothetical protein
MFTLSLGSLPSWQTRGVFAEDGGCDVPIARLPLSCVVTSLYYLFKQNLKKLYGLMTRTLL